MKKLALLFTIIFVAGNLFAQQRGFKSISVPDATNGSLYEYSYALVFGESEYTGGWPRLNGVKSDVPEVKRALEANGFYVVVKENIKSDDFDKTVKAFIATYGQKVNSRVLIYYAGHGHTIKNQLTGKSMGYVVPVDAPNPAYDNAGFLTKAVDMNQFNNYALQIQAKHTLFMFDACFAGTIFSGRAGVPPAIDYKTAQPVRQFITSGDESEVVADASIFRREFVNALTSPIADANKDGFLTASELSLYLYTQVSNNSNGTQHPVSGKLKNAAYNKGDFVFVLQSSGSSAVIVNNPSLGEVTKVNNSTNKPSLGNAESTIKYGNIELTTEISGTLYIDGISIGTIKANTKVPVKDIKTGTRKLEIRNSEETWSASLNVYENKKATITAKSTLSFGNIELSTEIAGDLYLDGTKLGTIKANTKVPVNKVKTGSRSIEIKGTENWTGTITVYENQTSSIEIKKSKAKNTAGTSYTNSKAGLTMVWAGGGTFQMGSNGSDAYDWEKPVHTVIVGNFSLSRTEITNSQYCKFLNEKGNQTEGGATWLNINNSYCQIENRGGIFYPKSGKGNYPVIEVTWYGAKAYCEWAGGRLPTEAEWEFAAKAQSSYQYSGSNNIDEVAWYRDNSGGNTHPVAQKKQMHLVYMI